VEGFQAWKDFFAKWPSDVKRRGVLVTSFGEQIPFSEFSTSEGLLLIERSSPDPVGARMVAIDYGNIWALKIIDPLLPAALKSLGFAAKPTTPR
jgi:hypothetical protein